MWSLDLPSYLYLTKKKKVSLNLNWYRNAHFRDLDAAKKLFEQLVREPVLQLGIPRQDKIHLHYVLYGPSNQRRDLMNVIAIVDKFFSDVLPKTGVIEDDHAKIIVSTSSAYGGVDPQNPRVSVTIVSVTDPIEIQLQA